MRRLVVWRELTGAALSAVALLAALGGCLSDPTVVPGLFSPAPTLFLPPEIPDAPPPKPASSQSLLNDLSAELEFVDAFDLSVSVASDDAISINPDAGDTAGSEMIPGVRTPVLNSLSISFDGSSGTGGGGGSDADSGSTPSNGDPPPPPLLSGPFCCDGAKRTGTFSGDRTETILYQEFDRSGVFPEQREIAAWFDTEGNVTGVRVPGYVFLPTLDVPVTNVGSVQVFEGDLPGPDFSGHFRASVAVTSVVCDQRTCSVTLDLVIRYDEGRLVVRGQGSHTVTFTLDGADAAANSSTSYEALLGVLEANTQRFQIKIDTTQSFELSGRL